MSDRTDKTTQQSAPGSLAAAIRRSLDGLQPPDIVVAVSGGPDSVALLRALVAVCPGKIVVAHLNHGWRGVESDADEEFVGNLAASLRSRADSEVVFRSERVTVTESERGEGLEAAARRVRYEWLGRVAEVEGCWWVATGHTADDQAETVLFNLIRGTGVAGLAGIAPRRPLLDGVELVRPLLKVRRADVLAYLRSIDQPFRRDSTNDDPSFTRNRIRNDLLPRLAKEFNPRIAEVLSSLAEQAGAVESEMEQFGRELLSAAELPRAGPICVFDPAVLAGASRHRLRTMFQMIWRRENWQRGEMGFREWDRLAGLCIGEGNALDLPGGVHARQTGRVVRVGPAG